MFILVRNLFVAGSICRSFLSFYISSIFSLIDRYCMMIDCWMDQPVDRPNFTALVQRLDHVIESNIAAMVSTSQYIILMYSLVVIHKLPPKC